MFSSSISKVRELIQNPYNLLSVEENKIEDLEKKKKILDEKICEFLKKNEAVWGKLRPYKQTELVRELSDLKEKLQTVAAPYIGNRIRDFLLANHLTQDDFSPQPGLFEIIFSCVTDLSDLGKIAQLNRSCYRLSRSKDFVQKRFQFPVLSSFPSGKEAISYLKECANNYPEDYKEFKSRLDFSGCFDLRDEDIRSLTELFPKAKSIILEDAGLSSESIVEFLKAHPHLTEISLTGDTKVFDQIMQCENLSILNFKASSIASTYSLEKLANLTKLTSFNINLELTHVFNAVIMEMSKKNPRLEVFPLEITPTKENVELLDSFTNLKEIRFKFNCDSISQWEQNLQIFFSSHQNLRALSFENPFSLSTLYSFPSKEFLPKNLEVLRLNTPLFLDTHASHLRKLKEVTILSKDSAAFIDGLIGDCPQSLERVSLSNYHDQLRLETLPSKVPNLKSLSLINCKVNSKILEGFGRHCSGLEALELYPDRLIEEKWLSPLISHTPKIKVVDLRMQEIRKGFFKEITNHWRKLETLKLGAKKISKKGLEQSYFKYLREFSITCEKKYLNAAISFAKRHPDLQKMVIKCINMEKADRQRVLSECRHVGKITFPN